jgi:hypothetical protein
MPGLPPSLAQMLKEAGQNTRDPSYRMSMLPFGTYPNSDGSESLGLAVPGMIAEPAHALSRLLGTPSNPGTFTQGPDAGSNSEDMRTLLETFLGGNATRGIGAVERGAVEAAPMEARAPVSGSVSYPGAISERGYHGAPFANGIDELTKSWQSHVGVIRPKRC